jgi:RNA polymerase sigma-70 factor (ECF subfamily)
MFLTPASLLYRLRDADQTLAWDRFVELYSPLMFHWAKKLGCQESDAADLVQDVFVILWRKLPEFEYDSGRSFHAWLKTIFRKSISLASSQAEPHHDGIWSESL